MGRVAGREKGGFGCGADRPALAGGGQPLVGAWFPAVLKQSTARQPGASLGAGAAVGAGRRLGRQVDLLPRPQHAVGAAPAAVHLGQGQAVRCPVGGSPSGKQRDRKRPGCTAACWDSTLGRSSPCVCTGWAPPLATSKPHTRRTLESPDPRGGVCVASPFADMLTVNTKIEKPAHLVVDPAGIHLPGGRQAGALHRESSHVGDSLRAQGMEQASRVALLHTHARCCRQPGLEDSQRQQDSGAVGAAGAAPARSAPACPCRPRPAPSSWAGQSRGARARRRRPRRRCSAPQSPAP